MTCPGETESCSERRIEFRFGWPSQIVDKKIIQGTKETNTNFLCPKIGVKCVFQHNIQKMTCPRSANYCPV